MSEPPVVTNLAVAAAAEAILTAQNANDDEPERFEATLLARVALEAGAAEIIAANGPHVEKLSVEPGDRVVVRFDRPLSMADTHEIWERARHALKLDDATPLVVIDDTGQIYAEPNPASERVAALEAALTGLLARFTKSDAGYRARISGTVLARLQAVADGTKDGGADGH